MDTFIWQTPEGHRYIILYFIIINLIGIGAMALDKYKAQKGKWRISEKTLFVITLLGGGIGTLFGMYKFRHKTKKMYFVIGFPVILIIEIIILIVMISKGVF
jgi:uncharacterized membrane protein YsdA (DUF1294 family)